MKKILTLSFVSILLLGTAYYLYTTRHSIAHQSLWELVPAEAVAVLEYKPLTAQPSTLSLQKFFGQDSVFLDPSAETLISFHITGKEDFGIVYYRRDSAVLQTKTLRGATPLPTRMFEGYTLHGIALPNRKFWYAVVGDGLAFSRESFLIEDVVRTVKAQGARTIRKNELLPQRSTSPASPNFYLNLGLTTKFLRLFFKPEINRSLFNDLGAVMMSELKIENETLTLSGFARDTLAKGMSSLSLFTGQHPVPSDMRKIISNRSLFFVHAGLSDVTAWSARRQRYCATKRPDLLLRLNNKNDIPDAAEFYTCLGNEIGQAYVDVNGHASEILLIALKNQSPDKLNTLLSKSTKPIEYYTHYALRKFAAADAMMTLLWPLTENNNLPFYCLYGNYVVVGEDLDNLKQFINDNEEDNTWGKSVEWNSFFSAIPAENNIGLTLNGAVASPWLLGRLLPAWSGQALPGGWTGLGKSSFQLARVDQNYYVNGVAQLNFDSPPTPGSKISHSSRRSFAGPVTSLSPVKNYSTGATEWLVQTNRQAVELLSADLTMLFNLKLKAPIRGSVHQLDFFKNKKLQYLFASGKTLYLIDRKGRDVEGFPKTLKTDATIEFISVADYDHTRNYRYLIADEKGNVYITDKEGKMLAGWNPKSLGSSLFDAPRSVRALGKDFIVCVDRRGTVYAFNRKGDAMRGFPVKTQVQPQGGWVFETRNAVDEGIVTLVSREGIKIQVSMNGKIVTRENFIRSSADSKFSLLPSPGAPGYRVSRTDKSKLSVLDEKGNVLFEKENPGSDDMEASYAALSPQDIFLFYDRQQEFAYLFDGKGLPVFGRPIETTMMPSIVKKAGNGIVVYGVYRNEVRKTTP